MMWLTLISISITALSAFFSLKSKSWDETKKGFFKFTDTGWILFGLLILGTTVSVISVAVEESKKNEALENVRKVKSVVYSDIESVCKQLAYNHFLFYKMKSSLLDTVTRFKPSV